MPIEFLTRNHVRNKFRKLPLKAIRPEHLQTAARKRYGHAEDVVISHGEEHIVLRMADPHIGDINVTEQQVNRLIGLARLAHLPQLCAAPNEQGE